MLFKRFFPNNGFHIHSYACRCRFVSIVEQYSILLCSSLFPGKKNIDMIQTRSKVFSLLSIFFGAKKWKLKFQLTRFRVSSRRSLLPSNFVLSIASHAEARRVKQQRLGTNWRPSIGTGWYFFDRKPSYWTPYKTKRQFMDASWSSRIPKCSKKWLISCPISTNLRFNLFNLNHRVEQWPKHIQSIRDFMFFFVVPHVINLG